MKILQVIPYYYPAVTLGGPVFCVFELTNYLRSKNNDVHVYTTDLYDRSTRINSTNVPIDKHINYFKNLSNYLAYNQHIFLPFGLILKIKEIKSFDLIHFHEVYTLMHFYIAWIARMNNIPIVITPHGTTMNIKQAGRVKRKNLFYKLVGYKVLEYASKIIAITKQEQNSLISIGIQNDKIDLIPNGVLITDPYKGSKSRSTTQDKLGIPKNKIVLLFFGRIHPKKGLDILLTAFKKLNTKNILYLLIVGPVESQIYFKLLVNYIQKKSLGSNVKFIDAQYGGKKENIFNASDVFILPSYGEVLSISALEAASHALPLIVSRECGLNMVTKYNAGIEIEATSEGIIEGVERLLKKRKYKEYYGNNALRMVRDNFDITKNLQSIEKLYKSLYREN